jgi:hypothetical protein
MLGGTCVRCNAGALQEVLPMLTLSTCDPVCCCRCPLRRCSTRACSTSSTGAWTQTARSGFESSAAAACVTGLGRCAGSWLFQKQTCLPASQRWQVAAFLLCQAWSWLCWAAVLLRSIHHQLCLSGALAAAAAAVRAAAHTCAVRVLCACAQCSTVVRSAFTAAASDATTGWHVALQVPPLRHQQHVLLSGFPLQALAGSIAKHAALTFDAYWMMHEGMANCITANSSGVGLDLC